MKTNNPNFGRFNEDLVYNLEGFSTNACKNYSNYVNKLSRLDNYQWSDHKKKQKEKNIDFIQSELRDLYVDKNREMYKHSKPVNNQFIKKALELHSYALYRYKEWQENDMSVDMSQIEAKDHISYMTNTKEIKDFIAAEDREPVVKYANRKIRSLEYDDWKDNEWEKLDVGEDLTRTYYNNEISEL